MSYHVRPFLPIFAPLVRCLLFWRSLVQVPEPAHFLARRLFSGGFIEVGRQPNSTDTRISIAVSSFGTKFASIKGQIRHHYDAGNDYDSARTRSRTSTNATGAVTFGLWLASSSNARHPAAPFARFAN